MVPMSPLNSTTFFFFASIVFEQSKEKVQKYLQRSCKWWSSKSWFWFLRILDCKIKRRVRLFAQFWEIGKRLAAYNEVNSSDASKAMITQELHVAALFRTDVSRVHRIGRSFPLLRFSFLNSYPVRLVPWELSLINKNNSLLMQGKVSHMNPLNSQIDDGSDFHHLYTRCHQDFLRIWSNMIFEFINMKILVFMSGIQLDKVIRFLNSSTTKY